MGENPLGSAYEGGELGREKGTVIPQGEQSVEQVHPEGDPTRSAEQDLVEGDVAGDAVDAVQAPETSSGESAVEPLPEQTSPYSGLGGGMMGSDGGHGYGRGYYGGRNG